MSTYRASTRAETRRQVEAAEEPRLDRKVRRWRVGVVDIHHVKVKKWIQGSVEEVLDVKPSVTAEEGQGTKKSEEEVGGDNKDNQCVESAVTAEPKLSDKGNDKEQTKVDGNGDGDNKSAAEEREAKPEDASDAMEIDHATDIVDANHEANGPNPDASETNDQTKADASSNAIVMTASPNASLPIVENKRSDNDKDENEAKDKVRKETNLAESLRDSSVDKPVESILPLLPPQDNHVVDMKLEEEADDMYTGMTPAVERIEDLEADDLPAPLSLSEDIDLDEELDPVTKRSKLE